MWMINIHSDAISGAEPQVFQRVPGTPTFIVGTPKKKRHCRNRMCVWAAIAGLGIYCVCVRLNKPLWTCHPSHPCRERTPWHRSTPHWHLNREFWWRRDGAAAAGKYAGPDAGGGGGDEPGPGGPQPATAVARLNVCSRLLTESSRRSDPQWSQTGWIASHCLCLKGISPMNWTLMR